MIEYIEVRNTSRDLVMIINNAVSIIWQTEYTGAGSFSVTVPYTEERFTALQPDNYITRIDRTRIDRTELGFIEAVEMSYSPDEGRLITATGRFGAVLLERRLFCLYSDTGHKCLLRVISDGTTVETACRRVVNKTLIAPESIDPFGTSRAVSWLSLGTANGYAEVSAAHESTYQNALEFVQMLLGNGTLNGNSSQLGHKMIFDRSAKTMSYELIKGQETGLVFSQEFKNLLSFGYSYDKTLYKTKFLIGGEGEGAARVFTYRTRRSESPEFVREFCFESSKSKTYNDDNGQEHTYSAAAYLAALRNDCSAAFADNTTVEKIVGTVDLSTYEFGVDYNVGDLVTIRDVGISAQARIWSITEVQDENGYTITANFEGEA